MSQQHDLSTQPIQSNRLLVSVLTGLSIALLVICIFIFGGEASPEWGKYWRIRPLIVTPLAGATGGAFFYFINRFFAQNRWSKALAIVLGTLVFLVGLWMGIVLGLDGTMWN